MVDTAGLDEFDWTIDMRRQSAYVQDWTGLGGVRLQRSLEDDIWKHDNFPPNTSTIKNKEFWVLKKLSWHSSFYFPKGEVTGAPKLKPPG